MSRNSSDTRSILLISNLFAVGAAYGGVCTELAAHLSNNGWQVTTTSALRNRLLRPIEMIFTTWRARHYYQIAQIDVFSGAAFRWAEVSAWMLSRLGKPYILTLHGGNLPAFSTQHPDRTRSLFNSAACITTPSRYLLEKMHPYHPHIRLLPNPISIDRYPFRLRIKPAPRFLYLRALHKLYNPVLAIQMLKLLLQSVPDAQLEMVGPDKGDGTAQELAELIKSMHLSPHVKLVGAVPKTDVANVMNQAEIFINTTNVDNTPISVLEAMACGLCIVSTNVGGIPYLLTHEYDALLVPPNDPEAMAAAIRRILTEQGLATRLSRNARATAEQFDWSIVLPQWETLLTNVMKN